jgi:hypothetical protein
VARRTPEKITEAMDAALLAIGKDSRTFVNCASRRILERSEWVPVQDFAGRSSSFDATP